MARRGIDYSTSKPSIDAIRAAGATFACRYLAWLPNSKCLTAAEATTLRAGGIDVVSNWEYYGDWVHDYSGGYASGRAHATEAARQHAACGGPPGRPIYFSTDWDVTPAQKPTVGEYYRGVASVIGLARTGAYGGYWVVKYLFDAGLIAWGWQTFAWSGGNWDFRAQLRQIKNGVSIGGADCDLDDAQAIDFGQWGAPDSPTPTPTLRDDHMLLLVRVNGKPAVCDGMTCRVITDDDVNNLRWLSTHGAIGPLGNNGQFWGDYTPAFGVVVSNEPVPVALSAEDLATLAADVAGHARTPLGPDDAPAIKAALADVIANVGLRVVPPAA